MAEEITVHIKSSVDKKYEFTLAADTTVATLKELIAAEADIPAASQRLIYSGRVLKDQDTLEHYKIKSGHTIHLVKSAAARSTSVPTGSSTSTTGTSAAVTPAAPTNIATGQGAFNPLAGLTDARYAGYGPPLPSESMFGPDGGMQLPNEEDMERMMENPAVQQGINQMLSNPQMMDYLINNNPQLRGMGPQVREMMQSDFFRNMMTNPQMMRQAREMSRMMGGGAAANPFGGFGSPQQQNPNAMPAPGAMTADESNNNDAGTESSAANTDTSGAAAAVPPANPFASLFGAGASSGAGAAGLPAIDPALLANLFGGAGAAGAAAAPQDDRPPEVRYESQLRQLNDMGFFDFDANVQALRRSGGSVQGAIEHLLSG